MSETHNASPHKGSGQLTREQFLFYEMRTTAKLVAEGLEDSEVMKRIVDENLFLLIWSITLKNICRGMILQRV